MKSIIPTGSEDRVLIEALFAPGCESCDAIKAGCRMYFHLYFCPDRALEDEKASNSRLVEWQAELDSVTRIMKSSTQNKIEVKSTSFRGTKVFVKEEALALFSGLQTPLL